MYVITSDLFLCFRFLFAICKIQSLSVVLLKNLSPYFLIINNIYRVYENTSAIETRKWRTTHNFIKKYIQFYVILPNTNMWIQFLLLKHPPNLQLSYNKVHQKIFKKYIDLNLSSTNQFKIINFHKIISDKAPKQNPQEKVISYR